MYSVHFPPRAITNNPQYDIILDAYRKSHGSDERNTALRALGRARSAELIQRTLALTLGDEVKEQNIYMPLSGLRTHAEGIEALFVWMTKNWVELNRKLPAGLTMLGNVVQICTASFTKPEQKKRVEDFFKERSTKGFTMGLAQSLDSIEARANWLSRDKEDVAKWVKDNGLDGVKSEL